MIQLIALLSLIYCTAHADQRQSPFIDRLSLYSSLEDFLESADFDDTLRNNFLALKRSISLQPAKADLPRIIVYSANRELILSFNSGLPGDLDRGSPTNQALELMIKNPRDGKYDFYHADFRGGLHLSGPNPLECLECHTTRSTFLKSSDPDIMSKNEWLDLQKKLQEQEKSLAWKRLKNLRGSGLHK